MGFITAIKQYAGRRILRGQAAALRRNREVKSLNDSATVAIVFDPSDAEDYELVKKYVNYLKEMKKKVKALGFYNQKEVPQSTFSKLEFDYISLKDVNWYLKPSGVIVDNFLNEEYDLLIDLNIHDHFPLHYIAALSRAKYKVGRSASQDPEIYDMLIDTGKEKGLKFFLRNVDTYLLMLNKDPHS